MNNLLIIGNLTRDPEIRAATNGETVATFTVAVNRRTNKDHPVADYFRVSAWRQLGDLCGKYLSKGKKVAVRGTVRASAYLGQDGAAKAALEVTAEQVEFLSPRSEGGAEPQPQPRDEETGFAVADTEELPF